MPPRTAIPVELTRGPFTSGFAASLGIERKVLRGKRFRRLFRGVYIAVAADLTVGTWVRAAMLLLPADVVVSGRTALRMWGFEPGGNDDLEFSTNTTTITSIPGIRLRRRRGRLHPGSRFGLPVTGPDRTLVDCGTDLSLVELVQAAEHLIHLGVTTYDRLLTYCLERRLHGVRRTRRAMTLVMAGSESPMETFVRLMLVFARLPCPMPNVWIVDHDGRRVARGDLVYSAFKVIVEYDGWHHERSSRQRQRDRERREVLEGLGYRLIVITDADLQTPQAIPWRVHAALVDRGYAGRRPVTSVVWSAWFRSKAGPDEAM